MLGASNFCAIFRTFYFGSLLSAKVPGTFISEDKSNRRRNEPCEPVCPKSVNLFYSEQISDNRFHTAPLIVSQVQSGFRMTDRVLMWTTIIDSEWFPKSN